MNLHANLSDLLQSKIAILLANVEDFSLDQLQYGLTSSELERSERYSKQEDRQRYLLSHALKRMICAQCCMLPADSLNFAIAQHGKPYCTNKGSPFSSLYWQMTTQDSKHIANLSSCTPWRNLW